MQFNGEVHSMCHVPIGILTSNVSIETAKQFDYRPKRNFRTNTKRIAKKLGRFSKRPVETLPNYRA